jgi:hypothetical protein
MPFKSNTFEGGTDGVTITTANSGGTSGSPWDLVQIGAADATAEFDTARAAQGIASARLATTATAAAVQLRWSFDPVNEAFTRWYLYLPSTTPLPIGIQWLETLGFSLVGRADILDLTGPKLRIYSEGNVSSATGNVLVTRDAWVRIETRLKLGSGGLIEAKLFNSPDISTADEVITLSHASTNTVVERVRFGWNTAIASAEYSVDAIAMETSGYMGPHSVPADNATRRVVVA